MDENKLIECLKEAGVKLEQIELVLACAAHFYNIKSDVELFEEKYGDEYHSQDFKDDIFTAIDNLANAVGLDSNKYFD